MSEYRLEQVYLHPPAKVWRALTDPALVPLWTSAGRGGRPVGFSPVVGNRFQYVAKPMPGWNGVVDCEVLEVTPPSLLRYSWLGGEDDDLTLVACQLEPFSGGTHFAWEHTGFTGVGGFMMSKVLAFVRRRMLAGALPRLLEELDDDGRLRVGSPLLAPNETFGP